MSTRLPILVIAARSSRLYRFAESLGCEVIPRGTSKVNLAAAVAALHREDARFDLVVLDGHGNGWDDRPASFGSGRVHCIDLGEPVISARGIVLSLCFGGTEKYVAAVRACNPEIDVVGPTGIIYGKNYLEVVVPLIEAVAGGSSLRETMATLDRDPRSHTAGWKLAPSPAAAIAAPR